MRKIKKTELLKACETILQEYKDKTHEAVCSKCSLCKLYYHYSGNIRPCPQCPMRVFALRGAVGCNQRRCSPVFSRECSNVQQQSVIEFYKLFIKKLIKMTDKEINKPKAFIFLREIDEMIANKYGL